MTANRILDGLEDSNATGAEADTMARLGFLEWVFTLPSTVTARAARDALKSPAAQNPDSAAARAFVAYLEQATHPVSAVRRRGGRRLRLH